jgi:hypothetical protein
MYVCQGAVVFVLVEGRVRVHAPLGFLLRYGHHAQHSPTVYR